MDDSDSDEVHTDSMSLLDFQNSSSLSPNMGAQNNEIQTLKTTISSLIAKAQLEDLVKMDAVIQQALIDIAGTKQFLPFLIGKLEN